MKKYKSKWEAVVAADLKKRGVGFEYEKESWEYYSAPYNARCLDCGSKEVYESRSYTPDFFLDNGVVIEVKGKFSSAMRTKILEVIESNPDKDLKLLFYKDNYLTYRKKKTYSEWCDQKGIDCAVGKVPERWLK